MRKLLIALAGATALTAASAANAALTIGAAGSTNGTVNPTVTSPTTLEFDTTNAAAGDYLSFFQFNNDGFTAGVFSATASTVPLAGTTVGLLQLFTGGTVTNGVYSGGTLVTGGSISGSSNSLTLSTPLTPNTNYTFQYSGTLANSGNISGNAAFGMAAVPEPAAWALMLLGFGGIGMAIRRRRRPALAQIA
jgi:PEP-CTERM motif